MALGTEVVDFVGLRFLNDAHQVAAVAQIAIVEFEARIVDMRILINMVHPLGIERTGPALDAVDGVAFFQ